MRKFKPAVVKSLGFYVYRLVDPRNDETFYVGKGSGNRVFRHIHDELNADEDPTHLKLSIIRSIRQKGLTVDHIIHRHGMDEATALEVESALIDVYPSLTNIAPGIGAFRGPATAASLNCRYAPQEIEFRHKVVLVRISEHTIDERGSLYEAARRRWPLSPERANTTCYVLAIMKGTGICAAAYENCTWKRCPDAPDKSEFEGRKAEGVDDTYVGRIVPDHCKYFQSVMYARTANHNLRLARCRI